MEVDPQLAPLPIQNYFYSYVSICSSMFSEHKHFWFKYTWSDYYFFIRYRLVFLKSALHATTLFSYAYFCMMIFSPLFPLNNHSRTYRTIRQKACLLCFYYDFLRCMHAIFLFSAYSYPHHHHDRRHMHGKHENVQTKKIWRSLFAVAMKGTKPSANWSLHSHFTVSAFIRFQPNIIIISVILLRFAVSTQRQYHNTAAAMWNLRCVGIVFILLFFNSLGNIVICFAHATLRLRCCSRQFEIVYLFLLSYRPLIFQPLLFF